VNNVMESEGCDFCRQRKHSQSIYLTVLHEEFSNLELTMVPLQPTEVKGVKGLQVIMGHLFNS
ncbi:MAG: arsenical pump-driving ATPase GET3, partial [Chlorobiales bacterium]|nr:arsenical pump-driving ATPase GET3 [Chlorobiales bacterium]